MQGALDLIRECQQLLRGEREHLTPLEVYVEQRQAYWRSQVEATEAEASEPAA